MPLAVGPGAGPVSTQGFSLPTEHKPVSTNPSDYKILIYGRNKIGKTLWASSFPNAVFFSTEPGTEGLSVFAFNHENGGVTDWDVFRAGVELITRDTGRKQFHTVIIDTADLAYTMCQVWVCNQMGIASPGLSPETGRSDKSGTGWINVRTEFGRQIDKLTRCGKGVVFVSHVDKETAVTKSGDSYTVITNSMASQARKIIMSLVDITLFAEYAKDPGGKTIRALFARGNELVDGGCRMVAGREIPPCLPLTKEGGYNILAAAIRGEDVGLGTGFMPSPSMPPTLKEYVLAARKESKELEPRAGVPVTPPEPHVHPTSTPAVAVVRKKTKKRSKKGRMST